MTEGARWGRSGLVAMALVAVAATVSITWSTRSTQTRDGADVRVADTWDDAQDARRTGVPPRVLVDRSDVTIASSEVRHLGQFSPDVYLQVLRADGTNRMVFVSSADMTDLLYENTLDPSLEAVPVGSRTGYLRRHDGRTRSLGVPGVAEGDGEGYPALRLVPSGIGDDDLVALAASLHPRPAGQPGVVLPERLPLGLRAVGEGRPATPAGPWVHAMLRLPGVEVDADFRVEPSTGLDFQSRLGELVAERPNPEGLTLGGRPAWLLGSLVLWDVADGWRVMLHAVTDSDRMRELAASLRVVDQATWDAHQPPGYLTLGEREAEVARLLAAIPPPPGMTWAALDEANMNADPVRFRSEVASLAACAWAEEHNRARYTTGADPSPALQVLAGARDWPAVKEGGYLDPKALAGFAAGGEAASAATWQLSCWP